MMIADVQRDMWGFPAAMRRIGMKPNVRHSPVTADSISAKELL
jgi:hypothetical protein